MRSWRVVAVVAGVLAAGCAHSTDSTADTSSSRRLERLPYHAPEADARAGCSSVGARINALVAKGQFAEAEALIAEAAARATGGRRVLRAIAPAHAKQRWSGC
jgi:hypothetical protein